MNIKGSPKLRTIVVLNSKGGSGKTTLAFNIAGYIATSGRKVALVDMDPQHNSTYWLKNRPARLPAIFGVTAVGPDSEGLPSRPIELPPDIDIAVIDAPGALPARLLADYTVGAHAIVVPVMPSDLDIHAASKLIKDLLLVARVSRANRRLGVIPNRVRRNTLAYRRLMSFLSRLSIAVVGVVRDSQNYVTAAHRGMCIHELPRSTVKKDLEEWESIRLWLEQRLGTPLNERDLQRPESMEGSPAVVDPARRNVVPITAGISVAVLAGLMVAFWPGAPETDQAGRLQLAAALPVAATPSVTESSAEPVIETAARETTGIDATGLAPEEIEFIARLDALLVATEDEQGPPSAELMREKWQLSGVAQAGKTNIVLLTDRSSLETHRALPESDVDGWLVAETGSDYAVLKRGDEIVHLKLNDAPSELPSTEPEAADSTD